MPEKKVKKIILGLNGFGVEIDLDKAPLFKRKEAKIVLAGRIIKIPYKKFKDRLEIELDNLIYGKFQEKR